jgi:hypothetical protein
MRKERLNFLENRPDDCSLSEVRSMAKGLRELLEFAEDHAKWEADLFFNGDWSGSCVRMTQTQHDRMIELQAMRNRAVQEITGGQHGQ